MIIGLRNANGHTHRARIGHRPPAIAPHRQAPCPHIGPGVCGLFLFPAAGSHSAAADRVYARRSGRACQHYRA